MPPSPSGSTPRPRVTPGSGFKMGQTSSDQSYFSTNPTYSPGLVSTPLTVTTPSGQPLPPSPSLELSQSSQPEMLQRFAMCFPPPPTLSLTSLRHRAPESTSPHISTNQSSLIPPNTVPLPVERTSSSSYFPPMDVSSSPSKHTLHVQLPLTIRPEMITISANRGDKLKVVADAWHVQDTCHYEWQISFAPRDIDMTAIQAKLEPNGHLFIDIRRLGGHSVGR